MAKKDKYSFFEDVYEVVKLIPEGRVSSYGLIAEYLGAKGSARMVGWAMNNAHTLEEVPAHRVVNRIGLLTGKAHFTPPSRMQELLESEGIEIENDKILNFKNVVWNPNEELEL
ncbi:MGMT family protein [Aureibacter tunicatorum]|uniref:Methylated-DNA-protein-cysteine methyltransferase-like protein n=1 Tax=Aureibacter tunicatorum TaxID=866807 RepID=A0AAE4BS90_9BACT|nr:MGMT family protein [Aureibacter tunicatorum]MDR6238122.1 methylated-DNA-protein-cysteine methyltransferase-like protein [Aureibacter tunicatorum]BDD03155.1 methylated-DNA--protein-cysteine methyltransferase [Aureibacter tunicatorum]